MNDFNTLVRVFGLWMLAASSGAFAAGQEVLDLDWDDLVPKNYIFNDPLDELTVEEYEDIYRDEEKMQEWMTRIQRMHDFAPVIDELEGKRVRLSGYAIPLDFDGTEIREFLLVPYFGACIHVPPPPGNQIVYVKTGKGLNLEGLWDPVSVEGEIYPVHVSSALAEAGYTLDAYNVQPYEDGLIQ